MSQAQSSRFEQFRFRLKFTPACEGSCFPSWDFDAAGPSKATRAQCKAAGSMTATEPSLRTTRWSRQSCEIRPCPPPAPLALGEAFQIALMKFGVIILITLWPRRLSASSNWLTCLAVFRKHLRVAKHSSGRPSRWYRFLQSSSHPLPCFA